MGRRGPGTPLGTHTAWGVQGGTCFLGPDDEKLWEAVAGLFFGPNVFVPLVLTGILKHRGGGGSEMGQPGPTLHCYLAARAKHWGYFQVCGANSALALPAEPQRGGKKKHLSMGSQENAGWEEAEEAIQPNLLHRSGQLCPLSLSLGHQTGLLPLFPTCHSGSFSSEKIWKYFCASCTGGSVCSFRLVQELRKRTRCLKVYKPRRSLP